MAVWTHIKFTITTGNDDLRDDSSLPAALLGVAFLPLQQNFPLKVKGEPSWDDGSVQVPGPAEGYELLPNRDDAELVGVRMTLVQDGGAFETADNWDMAACKVVLSNPTGDIPPYTWIDLSDLGIRLTESMPHVLVTPRAAMYQ